MKMERDSLTPLYSQLAAALRRQIEAGDFEPGSAIPAESELVRRYQVSRITVRKALDVLVKEGLIVRQQGKGTFVRPTLLEESLTSLQGFAELMVSTHPEQVMEVPVFEFIPAPEAVAAALDLDDDAYVLHIERRHILEGVPIAYATIFLPASLGRALTVDDVCTTPIYTLITERAGLTIKRAAQTIRAVSANEEVAAALDVPPGAPLLSVHRITYSTEETPVEYIELLYRGDRHELALELYRTASENLLRPIKNFVAITEETPDPG